MDVTIKDRKVIIKIGKGTTLKEYKRLPKNLSWGPEGFKDLTLVGMKSVDLEVFGKFEIPLIS